jgi:hypothetical protein
MWRLCSGDDVPADVVTKLEIMTQLADEMRVMTVALCAEVMQLADAHGVVEVADAAQKCGVQMANVALPLVALKDCGHA